MSARAANPCQFVGSASTLAECPSLPRPEAALIGRSNVGKSSLLNALCRQPGLARVSATPGRTRLLNFFTFYGEGYLVDLPGYGYARMAQQQREWMQRQTAEYLSQRASLVMTMVLLDARLPPQAIDLDFLQWLHSAQRPFALVLTKADKNKPTALARQATAWSESVLARLHYLPRMFITSASKNTGIAELRSWLRETLAGASRGQ